MKYYGDEGKPSLAELEHYGVKGMKWGVRKDREARKDAEEFARAKLFYGEGAGTRRKLIKATVEAKSKQDSLYKEAFEHHLANQDLSKHADKARGERRRKDVRKSTAKTARGVRHVLNGNSQYASLAAAAATGGALYLHKTGVDKTLATKGKNAYGAAKNAYANKGAMTLEDFLKKQGMAHHGVKGMHWGVRKAAPITPISEEDRAVYGNRGATRIARNIDNGLTLKQAQHKERVRALAKLGVVAGAYVVSELLSQHGGTIMSKVSQRAQTNRERAKVTAIASKAAKVQYAKSRRGTYKVTSL